MTGTIDDAVWPASDEGRLDVQQELDQISAATALLEQAKGVLIFRYAIDACSAHKLIQRWAASAEVGIETVARALVHEICQGDRPVDLRFVRWLEDQLRHEFPDQPENLWKPADGRSGHDFGAHGEFDDRATRRDWQLWASQHHGVVAAGVAGAAAAGTAAVKGVARLARRR